MGRMGEDLVAVKVGALHQHTCWQRDHRPRSHPSEEEQPQLGWMVQKGWLEEPQQDPGGGEGPPRSRPAPSFQAPQGVYFEMMEWGTGAIVTVGVGAGPVVMVGVRARLGREGARGVV